jgi:hypothetical protein
MSTPSLPLPSGPGANTGSGFRPRQWNLGIPSGVSLSIVLPSTASVSTTVTTTTPATQDVPSQTDTTNFSTTEANTTPTVFYFDAVIRMDHVREWRITDHPVQNGASISDHAYALPGRLIMEIGMSDVMQSFQSGQWTGGNSRSVNCYQQLEQIGDLRIPFTLTTRLKTYQNMLVESLHAPDDVKTWHGLRARIQFRQIILGTVTTQTQSARPDQTSSTQDGTVNPQPIDQFPALTGFMNNDGVFSSELGAQAPPAR